MTYIKEGTSFVGLPVKKKPAHSKELKHKCPACKGHGYWNLTIDAYGPGKHFNSMCRRCNGWGWLSKADFKCEHKWGPAKNLGRCYNEYTCEKCGIKNCVDSSD